MHLGINNKFFELLDLQDHSSQRNCTLSKFVKVCVASYETDRDCVCQHTILRIHELSFAPVVLEDHRAVSMSIFTI